MLTIPGSTSTPFCDGVSRRSFLRIGSLVGGLIGAPDLFRLSAQDARPQPAKQAGKSVIMICLGGGPSQLDMYDMRPEAPVEYRGEFRPIHSKVPGMEMCELMPRQAEIADRFAVVKSLQWQEPCHQFSEMCTGFPTKAQRPSMGSLVSRFHAQNTSGLPKFIDLAGDGDKIAAEQPRYAGAPHRAFGLSAAGLGDLTLPGGMTLDRLGDRKQLRLAFDGLKRKIDHSGEFAGIDAYTRQALEMVTSNSIRQAFDLSKEPEKLVARYGDRNARFHYLDVQYGFDFESFIRARRLVEAGVPFVSLNVARWDHHCLVPSQGSIFYSYRTLLPLYDMAVAALINDLHDRGLSERVAVLVWGEFGRTPRVNKTGGRDHWPSAGSALIAGGGLKMGQYVGETDSRAERPKTRPYTPQNMLATLYHVLGIDPAQSLPDTSGRPIALLDDREPIAELI